MTRKKEVPDWFSPTGKPGPAPEARGKNDFMEQKEQKNLSARGLAQNKRKEQTYHIACK